MGTTAGKGSNAFSFQLTKQRTFSGRKNCRIRASLLQRRHLRHLAATPPSISVQTTDTAKVAVTKMTPMPSFAAAAEFQTQ